MTDSTSAPLTQADTSRYTETGLKNDYSATEDALLHSFPAISRLIITLMTDSTSAPLTQADTSRYPPQEYNMPAATGMPSRL